MSPRKIHLCLSLWLNEYSLQASLCRWLLDWCRNPPINVLGSLNFENLISCLGQVTKYKNECRIIFNFWKCDNLLNNCTAITTTCGIKTIYKFLIVITVFLLYFSWTFATFTVLILEKNYWELMKIFGSNFAWTKKISNIFELVAEYNPKTYNVRTWRFQDKDGSGGGGGVVSWGQVACWKYFLSFWNNKIYNQFYLKHCFSRTRIRYVSCSTTLTKYLNTTGTPYPR